MNVSGRASDGLSGLARLNRATSVGFTALAWAFRNEEAFRLEVLGAIVLVPVGVWLGHGGAEKALLAAAVIQVMIVELLNTGIETAIDRIGPEWHDLSKRAKDMGSAAVLLSVVLCAGIWAAALYQRFGA